MYFGKKCKMIKYNYNDILGLEKYYRISLINKISGLKSANLIGTKDIQGILNLSTNKMITTDLQIRKLKPTERPFKRSLGKGLHIVVNPNGSKYWRYSYRVNKLKQKTLALGVYPEVTLLQAKEKHEKARKLRESGIDPSLERKLEKINNDANTENTHMANV